MQTGDPSPVLSTGKAVPGVLGPVLDSSAQERHEHTGEDPQQGHPGDWATGTSLPWGKADRAETSCMGKRWHQGLLLMHTNTWKEGATKIEPGSFQTLNPCLFANFFFQCTRWIILSSSASRKDYLATMNRPICHSFFFSHTGKMV